MSETEQACLERIEELVQRVDEISDPASRETASRLMESILELHGTGLNRMMELACEAGDSGQALIRRYAADRLVSALLILHDLHPDDLRTRAEHALSKWYGSAELVSDFEGVVRVRLSASARGMKEAVSAAVWEAVPDAREVIVEESLHEGNFVPLAALGMSVSGAAE